MSDAPSPYRIPVADLRAFVASVFRAAGSSDAEARIVGIIWSTPILPGMTRMASFAWPSTSTGTRRAWCLPTGMRSSSVKRRCMPSSTDSSGTARSLPARRWISRSRRRDNRACASSRSAMPGTSAASARGPSRSPMRASRRSISSTRRASASWSHRSAAPTGGCRRIRSPPARRGPMVHRWFSTFRRRRSPKARSRSPRIAASHLPEGCTIDAAGNPNRDPAMFYGPPLGRAVARRRAQGLWVVDILRDSRRRLVGRADDESRQRNGRAARQQHDCR